MTHNSIQCHDDVITCHDDVIGDDAMPSSHHRYRLGYFKNDDAMLFVGIRSSRGYLFGRVDKH